MRFTINILVFLFSLFTSNCIDYNAKAKLPVLTGVSQKMGYLKIEKGQLFYWLIRAENNPEDAPIVLWLNGGPGSSSLIGLFYENGPYRFDNNLVITSAEYSWNRNVNMLYIDQPVDVGFSVANNTTDIPHNEQDVAKEMREALSVFFEINPEMKLTSKNQNRELYLFGESFAGTYIPWIATELVHYNKANPNNQFNLKGIGIGDGTVDIISTWETMPLYALNNNLISQKSFENLTNNTTPECIEQIRGDLKVVNDQTYPKICWDILDTIKNEASTNNPYDIRIKKAYDFSLLGHYLNTTKLQNFLGTTQKKWRENDNSVFNLLYSNDIATTKWKIRELLVNEIRVLIYNGDKDLLVNYIGTEKWLQQMTSGNEQYPAIHGWLPNPINELAIASKTIGKIQQQGKLTYIRIENAGHLVPMNQPENAYNFFNQFIANSLKN